MELFDLITEEQRAQIINLIIQKDNRYAKMESDYDDLFYAGYAYNRRPHSYTYAIISVFTSNTKIKDMTVNEIFYGNYNKMRQPELRNNKVILHICNSDCGFKSDIFKHNCSEYNQNFDEFPIYGCIIFTKNKSGRLSGIKLKIPDHNGKFICDFSLYKSVKLVKSA